MTKTSHQLYDEMIALRNRVIAGQSNLPAIQAWAAVARACVWASRARREERNGDYTRLDLNFFNNISRIEWFARAQIETRGRQ